MKRKSTVFFVVSVLAIGFLAYVGAFGLNIGESYRVNSFGETINRGLDLQGGVSVVEEVSGGKIDNETLNRTVELISMRVNKMGVSETSVAKEGSNKIRIEVPGKVTTDEVLNTIGKTGKLKFVGPDNSTILTGEDIKKATAYIDQETKKPTIGLELNSSGTKKFADATQKFQGQQIAIYMDEDMLTNPTVNDIITGGKAVITGSKSIDEAKKQADIINSGALPVTLKAVEVKTVGATLGATALPSSVFAGEIGIGIVLLLMYIWYRRPGLMADIGLIFYVFLVLLVFSGIGATLTLSGIAGFLLTVGMAVDANVLIFARIREELLAGKSVKSATEAGFHNALSSIVDSNTNTIIAGVVLYFLGSGVVKGFALTLVIGVLVSLFTALFVTKHLVKWGINMGFITQPKHFGFGMKKREFTLKIIERTKIWFAISLIIIVTGIGFMFAKGLNFGIDFKGGTIIQVNMGKDFNKAEADNIIKKYVSSEKFETTKADNNKELDIRVQSNALTDADATKLFNDLKTNFKLQDSSLKNREKIGETIGSELKKKAIISLSVSMVLMLLYIGFRFEFKFGAAAIIALFHDVLVTLSVYAIFNLQINTPFIAAMLTIIGYSISDTIVIFDRIRENQKKLRGKPTEEMADISISHTIVRSIYTVTTTIVTITCVHIFVPSVRDFTIPLIVGILSGCYSSIFIASPIWVILKNRADKKKLSVTK